MDLLEALQVHKHQKEMIQHFQLSHQQGVVLEEIILLHLMMMVDQVVQVVAQVVKVVLPVELEILLRLLLLKGLLVVMIQDQELLDLEKVELVEAVLLL